MDAPKRRRRRRPRAAPGAAAAEPQPATAPDAGEKTKQRRRRKPRAAPSAAPEPQAAEDGNNDDHPEPQAADPPQDATEPPEPPQDGDTAANHPELQAAEPPNEEQADEFEALQAIFETDVWSVAREGRPPCSRIAVRVCEGVVAEIDVPPGYPAAAAPSCLISLPWLSTAQRAELDAALAQAVEDAGGEVMLLSWVELLREWAEGSAAAAAPLEVEAEVPTAPPLPVPVPAPPIVTGQQLVDRKSVFVAHLARVTSVAEVQRVMAALLSDGRIRRATHNIMAYRLWDRERGVQVGDCDDDGEHGAASKMAHLLDIMGAQDVCIVVSRWYGGVHLGPDRFKHINNLTRQIWVDNC